MADAAPESGFVGISNSNVGATLRSILDSGDIRPGDAPSYELCKSIFISHPLGSKMAESPVRLAQSEDRDITVPIAPHEVVDEFVAEWKRLHATRIILNVMTHARMYGIASVAMGDVGGSTEEPVELAELWKVPADSLFFNTLDPLNTSGLIVDQDPNSPTFQKQRGDMSVAGRRWHRSRTCTMMNEESIYIAWTDSAFAYAGRSVYQRPLYPMKSFIWTMIADEMVARKAGLLVARMQQPGSIVDRAMKFMLGVKRALLKEAKTDNVISIGVDESIETVNLRNVNDAMTASRDNIIKNIATAADMPAKLLTQEAFVLGFGEGTEDAKAIASYVDRLRTEMEPIYNWFDTICQYRAWSPEFYATMQARYPERYEDKSFTAAFYEWRNAFKAEWPSLLKEPPSEQVKVDDVRAQRALNAVQVLAPLLDPVNQAKLVDWCADVMNGMENLFEGSALTLDLDELEAHLSQMQQGSGPGEEEGLMDEEHSETPPRPTLGVDSASRVASFSRIVEARREGRQARL